MWLFSQPTPSLDFTKLNSLFEQVDLHQKKLLAAWKESYVQIKANQENIDDDELEKLAKLQILIQTNGGVILFLEQMRKRYQKFSGSGSTITVTYGIKSYQERDLMDWILKFTGNDTRNQKAIIEILQSYNNETSMQATQYYIDTLRHKLVNKELLEMNKLTKNYDLWIKSTEFAAVLSIIIAIMILITLPPHHLVLYAFIFSVVAMLTFATSLLICSAHLVTHDEFREPLRSITGLRHKDTFLDLSAYDACLDSVGLKGEYLSVATNKLLSDKIEKLLNHQGKHYSPPYHYHESEGNHQFCGVDLLNEVKLDESSTSSFSAEMSPKRSEEDCGIGCSI